jgi:hypothetical protein
VVGALTSIANSAKKIEEHERKFNNRELLTLREANPEAFIKSSLPQDMARKRQGAGGSAQKVTRSKNPQYNSTRGIIAPTTRGGVTRNLPPRSLMSNGGMVISHCEPFAVATLNVSGAIKYDTVALIPCILPYLNGIASNFSKFTWLKLRVYYVPSCPTTTAGEIAMGNYYDFQDAIAATFVQVAQMKNGISYPPWAGGTDYGNQSVAIEVDCKDFDKPRYNYVNGTTFTALSNSDKNNYSPVNLAMITQGSAVAVPTAGRWWCAYTIRLLDPILAGINV